MKREIIFRITFGIMIGLMLAACQGIAQHADKNDSTAPQPAVTNSTVAFENIDVDEFQKKIQEENTVILDVRTSAEIQMGMIEGAIHADINQPDFQEKISRLDKGKTYLVYCKVGGRSSRACAEMAQMDFKSLFNLKGGYTSWSKTEK